MVVFAWLDIWYVISVKIYNPANALKKIKLLPPIRGYIYPFSLSKNPQKTQKCYSKKVIL